MQLFEDVIDELSERLPKAGFALDFLGQIGGAEVATAPWRSVSTPARIRENSGLAGDFLD
jgi:hypothetical protein